MPDAADRRRFAIVKGCPRVWAVASIHAEAGTLRRVHAAMAERLHDRDGLVYLGNLIGYGEQTLATLDELLLFRALFLARPYALVTDHAFLRGGVEEMWHKLLELQFAAAPRDVLDWMLEHGLGPVIAAYGTSATMAHAACREGPRGLTRWTAQLRSAMREQPGHDLILTAVRRAAHTAGGELLFVNAGIDPRLPLDRQRDNFWWGGAKFHEFSQPFAGFAKVIRGFERDHGGLKETGHTVSIDGGCGFGGNLIAACIDLDGRIVDLIEG